MRQVPGLSYGGQSLHARRGGYDATPFSEVLFKLALRFERRGHPILAERYLVEAIKEEERERLAAWAETATAVAAGDPT